MEKKENQDPTWLKFIFGILRILFALLLFFLIISFYLHRQKLEITWPIIVVCWTLFLYLRFGEIEEFWIGLHGAGAKRAKPEQALSAEEKEIMSKRREKTESIKIALAMHDLKHLLSDFSFFYGRWNRQGMSDIIRFSDAWSGRPLRYINHFADDIRDYLANYSATLREPLKVAIEKLREYVDYIKQFHKEGESLSQRCFSRDKYVNLMKNVAHNFKQDNFTTVKK